ncbi:MAG: hypothetical protein IT373_26070 [Polyangiaceae bacterium]|nr:hypothetical protein [Polyangiaceae bacterium]
MNSRLRAAFSRRSGHWSIVVLAALSLWLATVAALAPTADGRGRELPVPWAGREPWSDVGDARFPVESHAFVVDEDLVIEATVTNQSDSDALVLASCRRPDGVDLATGLDSVLLMNVGDSLQNLLSAEAVPLPGVLGFQYMCDVGSPLRPGSSVTRVVTLHDRTPVDAGRRDTYLAVYGQSVMHSAVDRVVSTRVANATVVFEIWLAKKGRGVVPLGASVHGFWFVDAADAFEDHLLLSQTIALPRAIDLLDWGVPWVAGG